MFGNKGQDKFSRYSDPSGGLSNRSLTTGEWYVSHKILLKNILIGVLAVWSVASVGFSLFAWGHYLVSGYFDDRDLARRQLAQFQNYENIQANYRAVPLEFHSLQVYNPTDGNYDFVVGASNKNERFIVKANYVFEYDGGKTREEEVVILPGATVPLAVLGHETSDYPNNAKLSMQKVSYERISPHRIVKVKDYIDQRQKFDIENVQFVSPQEGVVTSRITFDVTNSSVHEFWEPFFYVEILSGGEVVGVLSLTIPEFKPQEKRSIEVSTFIDVTGADDIRLTPIIDVFDRSVYKLPTT